VTPDTESNSDILLTIHQPTKEIQSKIKDMRLGKKVLDDEALSKMEAIIEDESQSIEE